MKFEFKDVVGDKEVVELKLFQYSNNDNTAIMLFTTDGEEYCPLSVNIVNHCAAELFTLDANNAPKDLIKVLHEEGIFDYTGMMLSSGFCTYPVCYLTDKGQSLFVDKDKLMKYELEDDESSEGGDSYAGETLGNFLDETGKSHLLESLDTDYSLVRINKLLKACGIEAIDFDKVVVYNEY